MVPNATHGWRRQDSKAGMRLLSRLGPLNGSGWGSGGTLDIHMSFRWLCFGLSGGLKKRWCRRYDLDLVAWAGMRIVEQGRELTVLEAQRRKLYSTFHYFDVTAFTVNTPGNSPTPAFPLLSPPLYIPPLPPTSSPPYIRTGGLQQTSPSDGLSRGASWHKTNHVPFVIT